MKNIKCVIRTDSKRKDRERSIYVRYIYNRRFVLFNTGTSVNKNDWNREIGRIRKSSKYDKEKETNYELINTILTQQERYVEALILKLISQNQVPTLLNVKKEYNITKNPSQNDLSRPKKQDERLFLKDFKEFIDYQTENKIVGEQTWKTYTTTYNKLANFQSDKSYLLNYYTINNEFYDKFLLFLRDQGLADNSVDKHIKNTKLFMNYALSKEKHTNNVFHTFKRTRTKADFVVLDADELRKLYYDYKPKGRDAKKKEEIRDAFVFGCTTGLRFGDLRNLTRGNFHISRDSRTGKIIQTAAESFIDVATEKTDEFVRIPLNHLICELIDKYGIDKNKLGSDSINSTYIHDKSEPAFLKYNSQLFNREIKIICREAGIKRIVKVTIKRAEREYTEGEKCDFVSSHTMRRTFITLLSTMTEIANIQAVSGHKDIKILTDYIKRSDKELNSVRGCFDEVFFRNAMESSSTKGNSDKERVRVNVIGTRVKSSNK